ncbi:hypothetical protein RUM43_013727 [Polyplax serrata]|uniref:Uncharacterized protein n=1 Tax=Polyplax serrata TaxID=468196 RepID=A0AAN8RY23_POLSC
MAHRRVWNSMMRRKKNQSLSPDAGSHSPIMRRLTSPRGRDLSTRRTLEPDWYNSESKKLTEEEDSDPYPDSDSTEIQIRRKPSKFCGS